MSTACGDGLDPAYLAHLYRRVAVRAAGARSASYHRDFTCGLGTIGGGAVTQLAEPVITPGPDGAVVLQCQAVGATGGQGLYTAEVARGVVGVLHLNGRAAVGVCSVAQLAVLVQALSPDGTAVLSSQ